jgi:hypothetical protein
MMKYAQSFDWKQLGWAVVGVSWAWSAVTGESVIGALHHVIPDQLAPNDDDGSIFDLGNSAGGSLDKNNLGTGIIMLAAIAAAYKWS